VTKGLLGKKLGMTQVFDDDGNLVPVTVIEAGPCVVVQRRMGHREGYDAIQIGFESIKQSKLNKPQRGHFARANVEPMRYLQEFRVPNAEEYEVGQKIDASVFEADELVNITGISKGKGYQGSIKRHGYHRGPMTHGSKYHRGPGSHGGSADPSRVFKGRKLPGHMGNNQVTVQNLKVVRVDPDRNVILVRGSVPGSRGTLVSIESSAKS